MCFKHQKYPSFSLSEVHYLLQSASGYPVYLLLKSVFELFGRKLGKMTQRNLPNFDENWPCLAVVILDYMQQLISMTFLLSKALYKMIFP